MKAITTKYHGPTNFKGSRVSASAEGGHRLYVSWDDALDSSENHKQAAMALAKRLNWAGQWFEGWTGDASVWVCADDSVAQFTVNRPRAEGIVHDRSAA